MVAADRAVWDRSQRPLPPVERQVAAPRVVTRQQARESARSESAQRGGHRNSSATAASSQQEPAEPTAILREYIAWFMTGERLEQRLVNSDGSLTSIEVEWSTPGAAVRGMELLREAAVELRFSNGMGTWPPFRVRGITAAELADIALEMSGSGASASAEQQSPSNALSLETVRELERRSSCKLSTHEALLLQRSKLTCSICLASYGRGQRILCLPCGRTDSKPSSNAEDDLCFGHLVLYGDRTRDSYLPCCYRLLMSRV